MTKNNGAAGRAVPPKKPRELSPESVLRWLAEANQFVDSFLPPEARARWRKIKNLPLKTKTAIPG
ncbi:MAG: hypothetical protein JW873_04240 [Candidatus Saganbacteria bacterium]|nr:hypothetical protein [Candidatus Saganbacteria bacterium]